MFRRSVFLNIGAAGSSAITSPCSHILHRYSPHSGAHTIALSREKALNSLTHPMIDALSVLYRKIRKVHEIASAHTSDHPSVLAADIDLFDVPSAVIIKGAGTKAFCAGGDIVGLVASRKEADAISKRQLDADADEENKENSTAIHKHAAPYQHPAYVRLFYTEYQTNYSLMTYPLPTISLIDGIVMGAGAGMSVHGSHRLTSEKATFAMPENTIGLFPDVGGSWFLPRLPHDGLGMLLALTGCRLKGADLVHAGVGTHYVPSALLPKVEEALVNEASLKTAADKKAAVDSIVSGIVGDGNKPADFSLGPHLAQIAKCFGEHVASVEEVLVRLQEDGSEWAMKQHKALLLQCPMSVKLAFAMQRRGAAMKDPTELYTLEYRAVQWCVASSDFMEGVTALLIDKTGKPSWSPASLAEVDDAMIAKYMGPTSHGIEWDPVKPFPKK